MRRRLATTFLLTIAALVAGTVAFVRSQAAADLLCERLEVLAAEELEGDVRIGRCEVDPLSVEVTLFEVTVSAPGRGLTHASADRIQARLRSIQGLSTRLEIESLAVTRPVVRADLSAIVASGEGGDEVRCELPELPVRLDGLQLIDGRFDVVLAGGTRLAATGVGLEAQTREDRTGLTLEVGRARVTHGERTEDLQGVSAELELDLPALGAEVRTLAVSSGDLSLAVRGRVQGLCAPQVEGTVAVSGAVERLAALLVAPRSHGPYRGRFAATAAVSGPLIDPGVEGSLEVVGGAAGRFRAGNLRVEGHRDGRRLILDRVTTDVIEGNVVAHGSVAFEPSLPTRLDVAADGVSLERLIAALGLPGAWVDARVAVTGGVTGTLSPPRLAGTARAEVRGFEVLDRPTGQGPAGPDEIYIAPPPVRIDGEVVFTADTLEIPRARLTTTGADIVARGRFPLDAHTPVRLAFDVAEADLAALGPIAGFDFAGRVAGSGTLGGPYRDPDITARVEARGVAFDGLEAGVAVGTLRYQDYRLWLEQGHGQRGRTRYEIERFMVQMRPKPTTLDIRISSPEARIEEVIAALVNYTPKARRFVGLTGQGQGTVTLTGATKVLTTTLDATAVDGTVYGQPYQRARVRGRLVERHLLEIDEVVASVGDGGQLVARGWADMDGDLAVSVSAREIPVSAVQVVSDLPVTGRVSGDLVVEGAWVHPRATGALVLLEGAWAGTALRPVRLRVGLDGTRLGLGGQLSGTHVTGDGHVELTGPRAFGLSLHIDEPELERWIPLVLAEGADSTGWRGRLTGDLELSGRLDDLRRLDGSLVATVAEASHGDLRIAAKGPVELGLVSGGLALRRLVLAGPETELSITGLRAADGALDLAVHGTAELGLLERLVPGIAHADGLLGVEATVTGTFELPMLVGSARIQRGSLRVARLPLALDHVTGSLAFSQNRVLFDGLSGDLGGGRVELQGEVALRSFWPERLQLGARLHEVRVELPEDLESTLSGHLVLLGPLDDLALGGEIEVIRARYTREVEVDQLLPVLRRRVFVPPNIEREPVLRLDVGLLAPGTVLIANRSLRTALRADLRVVGTDVRPGLLGTINAVEGRARFRGNEYSVVRAVFDFKDPNRIVPSFDVRAEGDVRDYRVFVHAYGTPSDPRVVLESEPELPETDVVTLATLGITTRDAEGLGLNDSGWAAADALFAISGLDRQVREFIPENPIFRDPSVRLTSGYSETAGQVSPRVAFESRLFTDDLRLRYSAPIGLPGQRTQAEYRITDLISAQAEWDTEGHRTTAVGNLGMDLKLRWEMD